MTDGCKLLFVFFQSSCESSGFLLFVFQLLINRNIVLSSWFTFKCLSRQRTLTWSSRTAYSFKELMTSVLLGPRPSGRVKGRWRTLLLPDFLSSSNSSSSWLTWQAKVVKMSKKATLLITLAHSVSLECILQTAKFVCCKTVNCNSGNKAFLWWILPNQGLVETVLAF